MDKEPAGKAVDIKRVGAFEFKTKDEVKKVEAKQEYSCAWLVTGEGEYTNHYSGNGSVVYPVTPEGTQWKLIKIHSESLVSVATVEEGVIAKGKDLENVVYQGQAKLVVESASPLFIHAIRESFRPVKEGRF